MSMNEIIRKKRKQLGYTQEQIAEQLGVSIPAVSKWENGTTYPDVALLPALARVLNIDVNTLLCFKMELSEIEVRHLVAKVSETALSQGIEDAFLLAEQKIHEYPTDFNMIHTLALTLQGTMMMTKVDELARDTYDLKIQQMHERVANSGNSRYADESNYMLAARAIREKNYDRAQELIDRLPEHSVLDKKLMQADLWMKTGKEKEAEKIYASKIISSLNQIQIPLGKLIERAAGNGDAEQASQLVTCGQDLIKGFGLWQYNAYVFSFEKAIAEENMIDTITILDQMFGAMLTSWDTKSCPIFKYIGDDRHEMNIGRKMLSNMLNELEESKKYDFLRKEEAFHQLINKYKNIISNEHHDK